MAWRYEVQLGSKCFRLVLASFEKRVLRKVVFGPRMVWQEVVVHMK